MTKFQIPVSYQEDEKAGVWGTPMVARHQRAPLLKLTDEGPEETRGPSSLREETALLHPWAALKAVTVEPLRLEPMELDEVEQAIHCTRVGT